MGIGGGCLMKSLYSFLNGCVKQSLPDFCQSEGLSYKSALVSIAFNVNVHSDITVQVCIISCYLGAQSMVPHYI